MRNHTKKMRRKILTYLFFVTMFLTSVSVFAEKPPEPPQNLPPLGPGLPIDGGLSLLLIAGAVYGVYAIRKKLTIND